MKPLLKRLISTLLVLSLAFASMPAVAFATPLPSAPLVQQQAAAAVIPDPTEADQQIYTIHLTDKPQIVLSSWGIDCLTDPEEAGLLLRQAMKERKTNLTIYYEASASISFEDMIAPIRDVAMAHTANPTEGDYLKWQRGEIGVTANYYSDNITNEYKLDFTIEYYTTAQQEAQVDAAIAALLQSLNLNGKTDYEKLCAVYDWMCANITYDNANLNNSSYKLKHTAYAALINRTAVCQGYAVLLYRLMLELGIDCRVVTGIGNGGAHGWNIIKLDGRYYNVDATWDATCQQAGYPYNFFLRSNATFEDHTRDDEFATAAFNTAYPMGTTDYTPPVQSNLVASGTCGANLTWELDKEGTLTISGTGAMNNYAVSDIPWYAYKDLIKKVVIDEGVSTICANAFSTYKNLTSVFIPSSLVSIGNHAFRYCDALTSVYIENIAAWCNISFDSYLSNPLYFAKNLYLNGELVEELEIPAYITHIEDNAFRNCTSLTSITIPSTIATIGESAFMGCSNVKTVTIANGVKTIGGWAFEDCSSLTSIIVPDSVTSMGPAVFADCTHLISAVIDNNVPSIGGRMFENCTSLTSVFLGSSIASIGGSAFYGCNNLYAITIPNGVTRIETFAFGYCSNLNVITLPSTVTDIADYAFSAANIWHVLFTGSKAQWDNVNIGTNNYNLTNSICHTNSTGGESVDPVNRICDICIHSCTHEWSNSEITKQPTCEENGTIVYICSLCNSRKSEVLPNRHYTNLNDLKHLCTCLGCNRSSEEDHTWNDGEIIKQPTFESLGQMEYICSECGHVIYQEIPMLNYTPGDLNGDDEVTDADAIYLLYATFDPDSYPLNQSADYNSDGELTDADAIYLLYATFDPDSYPLV